MNALSAIVYSIPFWIYIVVVQMKNFSWFLSLKKPPTYPTGTCLAVISAAWWSAQFVSLWLATAGVSAGDSAGESSVVISAWLFLALNIIFAISTLAGFARKKMLLATGIIGVYLAVQFCAIIAYAQTSWIAAILLAASSVWILYAMYAGIYMHFNNPPVRRMVKKAE